MPRKAVRRSKPAPIHRRRSTARRNPQVGAHQRMLELEGRVRGRGLDLMPRESHELRLLYDALKVPPLHRIGTRAEQDKRMLEWEVGRSRGMNPAGNLPGWVGASSVYHKLYGFLNWYGAKTYRPGRGNRPTTDHREIMEELARGDENELKSRLHWVRTFYPEYPLDKVSNPDTPLEQWRSLLPGDSVIVSRSQHLPGSDRAYAGMRGTFIGYTQTHGYAHVELEPDGDEVLVHPEALIKVDESGQAVDNPPGDVEDRLSHILPPMGKTDFYHEELPSYPGRYFTIRRHSDGDLTAAITNMHGVKTGAEVVVPEDRIADVYHYALHHGTLEGWEPESGGYGLGRAKENPSYPAGTIPYFVSVPQAHAEVLAEEANKLGIRARALSHGPRTDRWFVAVPAEQEDEANRHSRRIEYAAYKRMREGNPTVASYYERMQGHPPTKPALYVAKSGNVEAHVYPGTFTSGGKTREGFDIYHLGGGGDGDVSWHPALRSAKREADEYVARWGPDAPWRRQSNRAKEGRVPGRYTVQAARGGRVLKFEERTTLAGAAKLAKDFRAGYKGATVAIADGVTNRIVRPSAVRGRRVNPADAAAAADGDADSASSAADTFELFHGVPSEHETVIAEDVFYHTNLAELGELTELKLLTVSGYKAVLDFSEDPPLLCSGPDKRSLYLRGGNQEISLPDIHMDADEYIRDSMVLGEITSIVYRTKKDFDGMKSLEYQHAAASKEGTNGGPRTYPVLIYDVLNGHLSISGGTGTVEDRGLVG